MISSFDFERHWILYFTHDSKRQLDFTSIILFLTHLILGTASVVRPSLRFYFMVQRAPDIRDEVGLTVR